VQFLKELSGDIIIEDAHGGRSNIHGCIRATALVAVRWEHWCED